jgi:hypothetical protein
LALLFGEKRSKAMKSIILVSFTILFFFSSAYADDHLGNYSSNPYNPDSTSNPLIQVALIIRMAPMAVPTATNQ